MLRIIQRGLQLWLLTPIGLALTGEAIQRMTPEQHAARRSGTGAAAGDHRPAALASLFLDDG